MLKHVLFLCLIFFTGMPYTAQAQGYASFKVGYSDSTFPETFSDSVFRVDTRGGAIGFFGSVVRVEIEYLNYDTVREQTFKRDMSTLMANAYIGIGSPQFQVYVGGGIGGAYLSDNNSVIKEKSVVFASSVGVGMLTTYYKTLMFDVGIKYTFINNGKLDYYAPIENKTFSALTSISLLF